MQFKVQLESLIANTLGGFGDEKSGLTDEIVGTRKDGIFLFLIKSKAQATHTDHQVHFE